MNRPNFHVKKGDQVQVITGKVKDADLLRRQTERWRTDLKHHIVDAWH